MNHDDLMLKLLEQHGRMFASLEAIQVNLAEHMRRTSLLEEGQKRSDKAIYRVQGALALLSVAATIISILKYIA